MNYFDILAEELFGGKNIYIYIYLVKLTIDKGWGTLEGHVESFAGWHGFENYEK